MRTLIYLDESGDLGFTLDKPYQKGGSSRMLTLSALCVPEHKIKYIQRIVRAIYQKRKRPLKNELKSVDLNQMIHEASLEHRIINKSCVMTPMDRAKCLELQFIDFFAGLVWARYEFCDVKMGQFMANNRLTNYKLFFE